MQGMSHTVFITGGAGYVGAMLAHQFAMRDDVTKIVCVDKEPKPELLDQMPGAADPRAAAAKVKFIRANLADAGWQDEVRAATPDVIIHTAWQIREMYGNQKEQWRWNVGGSDKVFDLAFSLPSVKRLVHFSTVSSYSARPDNTIEHRFTEDEPFRDSDYLYAIEKRAAEDHLKQKYDAAVARAGSPDAVPQVLIIRPAAITGPRGRFGRIRFGLQSALSGQLKQSITHRIVTALVSFVPVTKKWSRQFIHEDDINDFVALLAFGPVNGRYEAFNASPDGPVVLGKDMAAAVGKKAVPVHPWLIRIAFFFAWHLSQGGIPTSRGGWKAYSYPVIVDGSKATRMLGFKYSRQAKEAFTKKEGRYANLV
jgi:nucleoside-diphosphate-sugar epimerase